MKYARIDENRIVREIIPSEDPVFPGMPVTERYSKDFLSQCLELPDEVPVEQDMEYLPLENIFVQQIRFLGAESVLAEQNTVETIPVAFSEAGIWEVTDSGGIAATQQGDELLLTGGEPGSYIVTVAFTETNHNRRKEQTIAINVANSGSQPKGD